MAVLLLKADFTIETEEAWSKPRKRPPPCSPDGKTFVSEGKACGKAGNTFPNTLHVRQGCSTAPAWLLEAEMVNKSNVDAEARSSFPSITDKPPPFPATMQQQPMDLFTAGDNTLISNHLHKKNRPKEHESICFHANRNRSLRNTLMRVKFWTKTNSGAKEM